MFSTLGFIPMPDTGTLIIIGAIALVAVAGAVYQNKRAAKKAVDEEVDKRVKEELAKAARTSD